MEGRTTEKIFEVDERKFIIKKMDPLLGIAILKELLTRSFPIDLLSMIDSSGKSKALGGLISSSSSVITSMGIDEFVEFQRRILSFVYELLPSGEVQVIDKLGNYKVLNLKEDMSLNLRLLVEVLKVNYTDFFIEILQDFKILEKLNKEEESQELK